MAEIQSPCILVCSIDLKTGFCFGCGRSRDEISQWMTYSADERSRIMAGLEARLATIERRPRRETRRSRLAKNRADEQNRNTGT